MYKAVQCLTSPLSSLPSPCSGHEGSRRKGEEETEGRVGQRREGEKAGKAERESEFVCVFI